jgi:membrane protein insertase Oxa1/YidC/SpoIIIJ
MSSDERKIAERMLMNELKELQKENWVDVEVSPISSFFPTKLQMPPFRVLTILFSTDSHVMEIYSSGTSP